MKRRTVVNVHLKAFQNPFAEIYRLYVRKGCQKDGKGNMLQSLKGRIKFCILKSSIYRTTILKYSI